MQVWGRRWRGQVRGAEAEHSSHETSTGKTQSDPWSCLAGGKGSETGKSRERQSSVLLAVP